MKNIRFKKLRLWVSYPFAGLYLFFVYRDGINLRPGIWLIVIGLLLRFWAAGYIKKIRKLTTCGPYSFVRNPLYVGNFLIGLGFSIFVDNLILPLTYTIIFFFVYAGTIRKEEELLSELFAKDYIHYKKKVPAFIPRLSPYEKREHMKYSLEQAHYNGELIRILLAGMLLCVLYFVEYGFKQKPLDLNNIWLLVLIISVQTLLLVVIIAHRKKLIQKLDGNKII